MRLLSCPPSASRQPTPRQLMNVSSVRRTVALEQKPWMEGTFQMTFSENFFLLQYDVRQLCKSKVDNNHLYYSCVFFCFGATTDSGNYFKWYRGSSEDFKGLCQESWSFYQRRCQCKKSISKPSPKVFRALHPVVKDWHVPTAMEPTRLSGDVTLMEIRFASEFCCVSKRFTIPLAVLADCTTNFITFQDRLQWRKTEFFRQGKGNPRLERQELQFRETESASLRKVASLSLSHRDLESDGLEVPKLNESWAPLQWQPQTHRIHLIFTRFQQRLLMCKTRLPTITRGVLSWWVSEWVQIHIHNKGFTVPATVTDPTQVYSQTYQASLFRPDVSMKLYTSSLLPAEIPKPVEFFSRFTKCVNMIPLFANSLPVHMSESSW